MFEVSPKSVELNFSDKTPGFSKTIELWLNFYMDFCVSYV